MSSSLSDDRERQLSVLYNLLERAGLKPEDHIADAPATQPYHPHHPHGVYTKDGQEYCPKCGTQATQLHVIQYNSQDDTLDCRCSRCGYGWTELPADR